ncbi:hypothetical protein KKH23_10305 [Patescibacteria group bacterium]|nr:hypothetical protein [Patescibacteria group bacterium]MBU0847565.1 hypothetical protein [Patescibacteria group bacterium]
MDKREEAKRLLNSYLEMLAKGQDLHWDSDNRAEVGEIVDLIIDATRQEIAAAMFGVIEQWKREHPE